MKTVLLTNYSFYI